jgi:pyruvate formate-lyase activating enzyme-like uncharacterized protein
LRAKSAVSHTMRFHPMTLIEKHQGIQIEILYQAMQSVKCVGLSIEYTGKNRQAIQGFLQAIEYPSVMQNQFYNCHNFL